MPTHPVGEVGLTYAPVTYQPTGGNAPYVLWVSNGALPAGLSISADGVVSGTPAVPGTFAFTVTVADAALATADENSSIVVAPALTATLAHSGTITIRQGSGAADGAFGSQAGGQPPYTYSITSGSLPAGTALNGLSLSGTYRSAGTYRFTVAVKDSLGATTAVSPSYYVWGPIAFPPMWYTPTNTADHRFMYADVECRGTNATGCSAQFPYTGGTPGVTPTVSDVYTQAAWQGIPGYVPGQDSVLHGLTVTVYGGAVHIKVAPNTNPLGWTAGKVFVVLMDPQTHESTRPAEFRITVFS